MSYTVGEIRSRYMNLIASDEVHFFRLLNEAHARLLETAKWNWCKSRATLTSAEGILYLDPAVYAALLGVIVDDGARIIRTQEIEFTPLNGGSAVAGESGLGYLVDCGIVDVVLTPGDDPVKRKKYKIADIVTDDEVECLLHLAHVPFGDNTDYLLCPSARAIKLAMQAVVYEEADDMERAQTTWAAAYQVLNEQEATQRGGARGTISVQPFGEGIEPVQSIT